MSEITLVQALYIGLIFVWSGFVRSGIGFGGAALSLPLLLLIIDQPLFWLPIVATHLLIFSCATLYKRLDNVDWGYLKKALWVIFIPKLIGVMGLLNLPSDILVIMIYAITFFYGLTYIFNYTLKSENRYVDRTLLVLGAYASGTSLIGAPLISAVFARHVELSRLRDTLFVLWIILVLIKMSTFVIFEIDMQFKYMIYLLPFVTVGHLVGLKAHGYLIHGQGNRFKMILGLVLVVICGYGLFTV